MAEFPFRDALALFRTQIRGAIAVGIDERQLDEFIALFEADFAALLSNDRGDAIWRRDGKRVQAMGGHLGNFAEFVATAERGDAATVGLADLRRALAAMKPHCQLGDPAEQRREWCSRVAP